MDALLDGKRAVCRKCGALDWECLQAARRVVAPYGVLLGVPAQASQGCSAIQIA